MPPAEEFTVELWFQPACTVTNRTRGQILFRTLDPAAMLSPQVSIQGGNVVLEALLSDPVIPNQYFSALVRLEAPPPPPAAAGGDEGWGEWGSSSWHHIAFTVNVTHAAAYRNGTLVASQEIPNQVEPPDSSTLNIPSIPAQTHSSIFQALFKVPEPCALSSQPRTPVPGFWKRSPNSRYSNRLAPGNKEGPPRRHWCRCVMHAWATIPLRSTLDMILDLFLSILSQFLALLRLWPQNP